MNKAGNRTICFTGTVMCLIGAVLSVPAAAQEGAALKDTPAMQNSIIDRINNSAAFAADEYGSLVFTFWERKAIEDARNSRGMVRAPSEEELFRELNTRDDEPKPPPPPESRNITLGGIVYKSPGDWTIWLNGKRVSPDALPEEALDIRVFKDYVEIKWFDEYTDQIFPIRLRPHQRFNVDTRIFLPG